MIVAVTAPVESLTQQLIHRTTDPFSLALLTGVASSSYWLFGSLGIATLGTLPATFTKSDRAKAGVSDTSALKLWEWVFKHAAVSFLLSPACGNQALRTHSFFVSQKRFGAAAMLSGTSFLVASVFRPNLRPILYGASFFSFSALPYTLAICKCRIPPTPGTTQLN
jgi:hypothetical protein